MRLQGCVLGNNTNQSNKILIGPTTYDSLSPPPKILWSLDKFEILQEFERFINFYKKYEKKSSPRIMKTYLSMHILHLNKQEKFSINDSVLYVAILIYAIYVKKDFMEENPMEYYIIKNIFDKIFEYKIFIENSILYEITSNMKVTKDTTMTAISLVSKMLLKSDKYNKETNDVLYLMRDMLLLSQDIITIKEI